MGGSMRDTMGGSRGGSMKGSMSVTPWVIRDTMCHPRCHSGDTMGHQRHHGLPETPWVTRDTKDCHASRYVSQRDTKDRGCMATTLAWSRGKWVCMSPCA